jgi:hypothetical protein
MSSSFFFKGCVISVTFQACPIRIAGVTGAPATAVNGVFEPVEEVYNGKTLYRKRGDEGKWLRYSTVSAKWTVSGTSDKEANNTTGWCISAELRLNNPLLAKSWEVFVDGSFTVQASAVALELVLLKLFCILRLLTSTLYRVFLSVLRVSPAHPLHPSMGSLSRLKRCTTARYYIASVVMPKNGYDTAQPVRDGRCLVHRTRKQTIQPVGALVLNCV